MCFPRFIAAAQSAWSINKPPYSQFKAQLAELTDWFGVENAAKQEEWDPKPFARLPDVIRHFCAIAPVESIRKHFTEKRM